MSGSIPGNEREIGLIGGVERRAIELVPSRPDWAERFQWHRREIVTALGPLVVRIEHVGSTAVAGLAAKPIVDILIVVPDSSDEEAYLPRLQARGYQLRVREPAWHEHRMLRTPEKDLHVHVFSVGSSEVDRMLRFRDELRRDARVCHEYEALKLALAKRDWQDMNAYAAAKSDFIERIIAGAA